VFKGLKINAGFIGLICSIGSIGSIGWIFKMTALKKFEDF